MMVQTNLSRRAMLGGTAAACAVVAPIEHLLASGRTEADQAARWSALQSMFGQTTRHPDAELLALGADLDRVDAQAAALPRGADFSEHDTLTQEGAAITKRMLVIRPTTLEGHRAKARAFVWCADEMPEHDYFGTTTDAKMAVAIIRDLLAA